jgi:hypothetical protein
LSSAPTRTSHHSATVIAAILEPEPAQIRAKKWNPIRSRSQAGTS